MSSSAKYDFLSVTKDSPVRYIPRLSSKTGQVVGIEEFLQWNAHDKKGMMLSRNSASTASDFAQRWQIRLLQLQKNFDFLKQQKWSPTKEHPDFFLSIHLSSKQLADEDWALQLMHVIEASGIPGHCVEVELTEHDEDISNNSTNGYSFDIVRNAGVTLTLNNFPASPTSFLRLAHWKFDKIKLNRMMTPSSHESITMWVKKRDVLAGLISIAMSMQAHVVIDGIEKEEQFDFLGKLPVAEWQGPYWGESHTISDLLPQLHFINR